MAHMKGPLTSTSLSPNTGRDRDSSGVAASATATAQKVLTYETFLNETLKTDLGKILEQREGIYGQIAEYMEQETILKRLSDSGKTSSAPVRLKVDLGCNFYAQAEVPSTQNIVFDIGCGIYLSMSKEEGLKLCEQHIKRLNRRVELLTKQELHIKAQINIVIEALRQIQGLGEIGES